MPAINVRPNQDGGWSVERSRPAEEEPEELKRFDTKEAAVAYGRKICGRTGESLYVRREGGGISMKYEYRRT